MTSTDIYYVPYPRKKWLRRFFRLIGKILLNILARPIITDMHRLPLKGPAILAGNHVAVLEIVMMAVYSPAIVEFLGAGDIPLDPNMAWLANLYGYIPIQRGTLDRAGIKKALSVLKQGGIIGVFPQGGIWETSVSQVRVGAAFLSEKGEAPVTPIGFGGVKGALKQILRFKRPELVMNVGRTLELPGVLDGISPSREGLEAYSEKILASIIELIPEDERPAASKRLGGTFDVSIRLMQSDGSLQIVSENNIKFEQRSALGRFFHFPQLLDALHRNLELQVQALQHLDGPLQPLDLINACQEILDYLDVNPGFFTYRFGIDVGLQLKSAFQTLIDMVASQSGNLTSVEIVPLYGYIELKTGERIIEHGAPIIQSM